MKTFRTALTLAVLAVSASAAVPADEPLALLHFGLRSSTPAADAEVPAPEALHLVFTQVPQENSLSVRVIDAGGEAAETGEPTYDDEDRKVIHVSVDEALAAGAYTVAWRGIGDDGHVVRGDFAFTVTAQ